MVAAQYHSFVFVDGNSDNVFDIHDSEDRIQDSSGNVLTVSQARVIYPELEDRFYFLDSDGKWLGESQNSKTSAMGYVAGPLIQTQSRSHMKSTGIFVGVIALLWLGYETFIKPDEAQVELTPDVTVLPESDYFLVQANDVASEEMKKEFDEEAEEVLQDAQRLEREGSPEEAAHKILEVLESYDLESDEGFRLAFKAMALFNRTKNWDKSFEAALLMLKFHVDMIRSSRDPLRDQEVLRDQGERLAEKYTQVGRRDLASRLAEHFKRFGVTLENSKTGRRY